MYREGVTIQEKIIGERERQRQREEREESKQRRLNPEEFQVQQGID